VPCNIAGIDVHKKMLAVVVSDVEVEGGYQFERRMFGSSSDQLRSLAAWLIEQKASKTRIKQGNNDSIVVPEEGVVPQGANKSIRISKRQGL
jgi:hypothetical protein